MEERRTMIGQMITCGFDGLTMPDDFRKFIYDYRLGNVILFSRNCESFDQLRLLCDDIHRTILDATGCPALIMMDQEGGVVTRFPNDMPSLPGAMALASTGNPDHVRTAAAMTAKELKLCGINCDFAPVVDINSNPKNPVIGVRSYGTTPEEVIRFATLMMQGLEQGGIVSCLKHFPGHGDTATDSHLGLPRVDKTADQLKDFEMLPFQALIELGAPMIMTTHILYPAIDPEYPATMSRRILSEMLRQQLGFTGVIVTDCVEMNAIKDHYSSAAGGVMAVHAGADMVCVSHHYEIAREIMDRLWTEGSDREIEGAFHRIDNLKKKYCVGETGGKGVSVTGTEDTGLAQRYFTRCQDTFQRLREQCVHVVSRAGAQRMPDRNTIFLCTNAYQSTQVSGEPYQLNFADYMGERLGSDALTFRADPDDAGIEEAAARFRATLQQHSEAELSVVIGSYNAFILPRQEKLIGTMCRILEEDGRPFHITAIAFRNPNDLFLFDPGKATRIAAYEYTPSMFEALYTRLMMPGGIHC